MHEKLKVQTFYLVGELSISNTFQKVNGGINMIENPMVVGNRHDSVINDFKDHCKSCSKEIYFDEEFWDIDGDYIHDERECINRYVESHFTKMIAGE